MRAALGMLLSLVAVLALVATSQVRADEGKEQTLKGTLTCAKCGLQKASKCHTVLVVKKGDNETVYYLDKGGKDNHKAICTEAKPATVTGTVSEKDGKHYIKATKIDLES